MEQDNKTAFHYLQQAASQSACPLRCCCMVSTELGSVLTQVGALAFSLSRAADHPYAQALLGYMYLHGMGVERNVKEAVNYFWKSAEQGNSDGILHLANCYFCTYARVLPASSCVPRSARSSSLASGPRVAECVAFTCAVQMARA